MGGEWVQSATFVSIHSRLLCREIRPGGVDGKPHHGFQSTPGFYAGRYKRPTAIRCWRPCFNPLPAFMPGDTRVTSRHYAHLCVSIHSRLLCREIPSKSSPSNPVPMFQSTPGFYAGRYARRGHWTALHSSFNPLPAFMPGDTVAAPEFGFQLLVSIHSRLLCREILAAAVHAFSAVAFQSTPGFYAGRYLGGGFGGLVGTVSIHSRLLCREIQAYGATRALHHGFQSTPGFYAGRYKYWQASTPGLECFNPLPAFMPGDTWPRHPESG